MKSVLRISKTAHAEGKVADKEFVVKLIFRFILCMLLFCGNLYANEWLEGAEGYARGRQESFSDGKPLMVYFYTDWCPYCKKFEKQTLSNVQVQKALSPFVLVRINPEKGEHENELADHFQSDGFPAVFFLSPKGRKTLEITQETRGAQDFTKEANEFSKVIAKMITQQSKN